MPLLLAMNILVEGSLKLSNLFIHPGYVASSPSDAISPTGIIIIAAGLIIIFIILAHTVDQYLSKNKEEYDEEPPPP